jgi:hypothetical protein
METSIDSTLGPKQSGFNAQKDQKCFDGRMLPIARRRLKTALTGSISGSFALREE